jgi:uncharacterized transporter YbjL
MYDTTLLDIQMIALALIVSIFSSAIFGFLVGRYHERMQWNRLIDKGLIPRPSHYR